MAKFPLLLLSLVIFLAGNPHDGDKAAGAETWLPTVLKGLHAMVVIDFFVGNVRFARVFYPLLAALMMVVFLAASGGTPAEIRIVFGVIGLAPYIIAAVESLRQRAKKPNAVGQVPTF